MEKLESIIALVADALSKPRKLSKTSTSDRPELRPVAD
jgi:hypothetical protein